jgi:hypothetical protein
MQEPEQLRRKGHIKIAHARDVATRPVETGNEAEFDWVATDREGDRYRRCCRLGRNCPGGIERRDDRYLTANQIGRKRWQTIEPTFGPAVRATLRPST